jgi:hypothetical protein
VRHRTTKRFWQTYQALPESIRSIADKNFLLLKSNPRHPSLHFKRIGQAYSVRVGRDFLALALARDDDAVWFWIGSHAEYNQILRSI